MESFEVAGGRFDVTAAETVIAAVSATPPGPPRAVLTDSGPARPTLGLVLRPDGERVRLEGRITSQLPGFDGPLHQFMIGSEYVAPVVEALGRLFEAPKDAGGETITNGGVSASVSTGRPMMDGRVTDRLLATVRRGDLTPQVLTSVLKLLVEVGARREGDGPYLRGRSFRLDLVAAPGRRPEPVPSDVRLEDLGGLEDVVGQLRDVADSFLHPEVMARWGARRPQGILMWGPPGTGKTTLARALANEIGGTLKEVRSNEILDRWMGASERNIAKVFADARRYTTPTVLLFDEFDSIVSYTGRPQGSADQAINSVAGIFKQEMNDLVEANPNVIVVATTNFPERVDESLIRSGRFDVKMGVPLPGNAARADILAKQIRALEQRHGTDAFRLFAADLSIPGLAEQAVGLSGADLAELLRRAQLEKAMTEARGGSAGPITQEDLLRGIDNLTRATA